MGRTGPAGLGTRSARVRLRLVHRGLRYRRFERGQDSPDRARLSRFVATIEIAAVDDPTDRFGGWGCRSSATGFAASGIWRSRRASFGWFPPDAVSAHPAY